MIILFYNFKWKKIYNLNLIWNFVFFLTFINLNLILIMSMRRNIILYEYNFFMFINLIILIKINR
jgi:hypothetical protein